MSNLVFVDASDSCAFATFTFSDDAFTRQYDIKASSNFCSNPKKIDNDIR
jgi:hypothetical protein